MSVASASQSGVTANRPDEPAEPRKDRLITRDVALVMLATFFFMTSNMVITPVIAGYGESMGATGALMGVIAGAMSFVSLFCRPIAGNLSDLLSCRFDGHAGRGAHGQRAWLRMRHGLSGDVGVAAASDPAYGRGHGIVRHRQRVGDCGRPGTRHPSAGGRRLPVDVHRIADA